MKSSKASCTQVAYAVAMPVLGALLAFTSGCGSGTEPLAALNQSNSTPSLSLPITGTNFVNLLIPYSQSGLGTASDGFDIQISALSPTVLSPGGGIVTFVDNTTNAAIVYIQHNTHLMTRLSKLQTVTVQPGAIVQPGSGLGLVATTGTSAFVIHFSVLFDNSVVCPLSFLNPADQKLIKITSGVSPCI